MAVERDTGLALEERVQDALLPHTHLVDLANGIYICGHCPVIGVTLAWLACCHWRCFLRVRDAMLLSGAVGLIVFATYPVAPPRLAGLGLADTVTQRSHAYRVLQPPGFTDRMVRGARADPPDVGADPPEGDRGR